MRTIHQWDVCVNKENVKFLSLRDDFFKLEFYMMEFYLYCSLEYFFLFLYFECNVEVFQKPYNYNLPFTFKSSSS